MSLVRGPWTLKWGDNVIDQVEELEVEYEQDTEDYTTLQHQTYELDGPVKATATITLLGTDTAALAAIVPQYHVDNGDEMSTGETVNQANGALDVGPLDCSVSQIYNNLDIISCANPSQTFRIVNARTKVDGIEFDDKIRKVMVRFIGEPAPGERNVQFFQSGSISVVS